MYGYLLTSAQKWSIYDALQPMKYDLESKLEKQLRDPSVSSYAVRNTAKYIVTHYRALDAISMLDGAKFPVFTKAEMDYDGTVVARMAIAAEASK